MHHIDLQIEDYLSGKLDPTSVKSLESHLQRCGECRDTLETMKTVMWAEKRSTRIDPAYVTSLLPRIRARIAEGTSRQGSGAFDWSWIGAATTRVVLPIGAMVLAILFLSKVQTEAPSTVEGAGVEYSSNVLASEDLIEYVSLERATSEVASPGVRSNMPLDDRILVRTEILPQVTEGLEALENPSEVYDLLADMDEDAVDTIIAELNLKPSL